MAKGLNLKAIFSADTSNLKQGSKEATNAIKSFEKESYGALGSLAGAMGINVDALKRFSAAGKGAEIALKRTFKGAEDGAKALSGKIGLVAGGLGALVVGAAVASWKELNAQAEHFYKNSVEGARSLTALEAYTSTFTAAIREASDVEGAAAIMEQSKKWNTEVKGFWRSLWLQFLSGYRDEDDITHVFNQRIQKARKDTSLAQETATKASGLASMIYTAELELKRLQNTTIASMKKDYERERLAARNKDLSPEERLKHQQEAQRILNEMTRQESVTLEYILNLKKQYNDLTMTSEEAELEMYRLEKERENALAVNASQMRELLEYENTLKKEIITNNANIAKRAQEYANVSATAALDALTQEELMPIDFEELTNEAQDFFDTLSDGMGQTAGSFNLDLLDVEAAKALDAAKAVAQQINNSFSGIIQGSISGFSDLIGQSIAGTTNFADGLWSMFGDILKQLGEIAIAAGVGMLGIKEAFKTLNPWVAITAGAALVALGAAISNSVSSLSNDIGSAGGGYVTAGSAAGYANNLNRAPSSEGVEVTGRFEIKGDDLVAVIGRNNKRRSYVG